MKYALLSFLLALSITPLCAQDNFAEGMRWYSQRTSGAKELSAKPEHINKAIPHFEKALERKENELETGIYLMRSYIFKARFVLTGKSDRRKCFRLAK